MIKGMQEVIDVMTKAKADLDKNGGLKQVIFVACGGSFASSYPARFLLNQESSIRVQGYNSSEFAVRIFPYSVADVVFALIPVITRQVIL